MTTIYNSDTLISQCIGKQKIKEKSNYRLMNYVIKRNVLDGFLLYNTLTGELCFLSKDEMVQLQNDKIITNVKKQLIIKWFLVEENFNEYILYTQISTLLQTYLSNQSNYLNSFLILPTTSCNARCFYCFEEGIKHISMTDKTAIDVARFIIDKSYNHKIKIEWFGGEPLCNTNAIDVICTEFQKSDIIYESSMTTNGYLFTDEIIQKSIALWNLKKVQISLDGTEKIYNECKNYVNSSGSAFVKVNNNIVKLLDAGINVVIRLNVGNHNISDLYLLIDYLSERYIDYKNFNVYPSLLYDVESNNIDLTIRTKLVENFIELDNYLISKGYSKSKNLKGVKRYNYCMADNKHHVTISPDGKLSKCECFTDKDFFGSIYGDEENQKLKNKFFPKKRFGEWCENCAILPICNEPKCCPVTVNLCNDEERKLRIRNIEKMIDKTYSNYQNNK